MGKPITVELASNRVANAFCGKKLIGVASVPSFPALKDGVSRLDPKRFQVFKVNILGSQDRRDYKQGLTHEEARAYPVGRQEDAGGPYFWSYSLSNDYPRCRG
jgi:hypothetical protein